MQPFRQGDAVIALEHERDATLARLAVDPHDFLVAAAEIARVDRQICDGPMRQLVVAMERHRLADRILVAARERGVDEIARPRVARMDRHIGAAPIDLDDPRHVGEVKLRIHTLRVQVHRHGNDVHVAGALAVAEQCPFDPVRTGHEPELGGRDGAAAIVVRVQAHANVLALCDVAAEVLDLVREHVRRRHLDRARQIDHDLLPVLRLPDVDHRVADVQRVIALGAGKALGRILERPVGAGMARRDVLQLARTVHGDRDDLFLARLEYLLALHRRRRVVDVHDGALDAAQRFERAIDELAARLREYLDGYRIGNQVLLDQAPREVELRLRRGRESDLDFLEAELDEQREHLELLRHGHRLNEGLVTVAQVDTAPVGRSVDRAIRPAAVGQGDRAIRAVFRVIELAHRAVPSTTRGTAPRRRAIDSRRRFYAEFRGIIDLIRRRIGPIWRIHAIFRRILAR